MSYWEAETKITRCLPSPAICEVVTELMRKMCEWQTEGVWTFDPVSITGTEKNCNVDWPWSQCKTMTCYPVWFSSKRKSSVPQDITQESPFTDGNHGAVKTGLGNSAAWFQLKHWISKTITPILMCIFYVFPVYFDGKFVGGALANWYGKLAPVVDQCFESQKHWIFAFFFHVRRSPTISPKQFQTGSDV